jgi:hypothetical protein
MCFHTSVVIPPWSHFANKGRCIFEVEMLKRFIALAAASIALALAASFYSPVLPSDVLTSSENVTQIRNFINPDDDYITYRHVFAHIYFEAHDKEKSNPDVNTAVEYYKHSIPLSEDEANVLAKIALGTETHTLVIEEQAATIIRRFRENIDAELKSGRKPSPEPPELQILQKQRVRTTLQGRDELRKAFGECTFSRFDKFLKDDLNLRIEKAIPSPQNN